MTSFENLYLKSVDEESAKIACKSLGILLDEKEEWICSGKNHAFIPNVKVWETKPSYDLENYTIIPGILENGWFANLRVRFGVWDIEQLIILASNFGVEIRNPSTPERVWF